MFDRWWPFIICHIRTVCFHHIPNDGPSRVQPFRRATTFGMFAECVCVVFSPWKLSCNNTHTISTRDKVILLFSFLICMFYSDSRSFRSCFDYTNWNLVFFESCPAYARGRQHRLLNRSFHFISLYYLANKSKYLPSVLDMSRVKKKKKHTQKNVFQCQRQVVFKLDDKSKEKK